MAIVETLKEVMLKGIKLDNKKFIMEISLTYFIDERKASEYLKQAKFLAKWKDAK